MAVGATLARAKSRTLACPRLVTKMLAGFDVAVNHAFRMCGVEAVCDLDGEREDGFEFQRLSGDEVLEGDAVVHELHDDERLVAVLADFADGAVVEMVESGGGAGFAAKTFEAPRVAREVIGQKFECDGAAEFGVLVFVDPPIPPSPSILDAAAVGDELFDCGMPGVQGHLTINQR
jgi:hypothetical protein